MAENGGWPRNGVGDLSQRNANGIYHVGDIALRYRTVGATARTSVDSVAARVAVTSTGTSSSNLAPTLP